MVAMRMRAVALAMLAAVCAGGLAPALVPAATTPTERGHDPWVFRSVLDGRPRMLTIALAPDLWAAYATESATLTKVWRGGVDFTGAVYNGRHGPQPGTQGAAFLDADPDAAGWRIRSGGGESDATVRYLGHRFEAGGVRLRYRLTAGAATIDIAERPEVLAGAGGVPGIERRFRVERATPGARAVLPLSFTALSGPGALASDGALTTAWRATETGRELAGALTLKPAGETRLAARFDRPPLALAGVAAQSDHPGFALIEANACASCHNPDVMTVGPSWKMVATRYPANYDTMVKLAGKIVAGGAGVWGEAEMPSHPEISQADAQVMVAYVLGAKAGSLKPATASITAAAPPPAGHVSGAAIEYFDLGRDVPRLPVIADDVAPSATARAASLWLEAGDGEPEATQMGAAVPNRLIRATGVLVIDKPGAYDFALWPWSGRHRRLQLDGETVLDTGTSQSGEARVTLAAGLHPFTILSFAGADRPGFALQWKPPGATDWAHVPPGAIASPVGAARVAVAGAKPFTLMPPRGVPGDGIEPDAMHPAFAVHAARPPGFQPRVGGIAFHPDGRLLVSTWDAHGAVYALSGWRGDPAAIKVERIAHGLAEPLGLIFADGAVHVLQKQELTRLVDHNGDGVTDEYRTVSAGWAATGNFHEFAFGLDYADGAFHATLASAVLNGGEVAPVQGAGRGSVIRIDAKTGAVRRVAHGFRTPNGIGRGSDGAMYVADNQGNWMPASKIARIVEGAFYGFRSIDREADAETRETPPLVWLPQDEIGNSPSTPVAFDTAPYRGQLLYGDVTHGGLKRVAYERVGGVDQGCVLRFAQGLEAGVNRIAWAPGGALVVGGIGVSGNWGQAGKLNFGLERLEPTGDAPFEMLTARVRADGIVVEFTRPLPAGARLDPDDVEVRRWRYQPTAAYGGPKLDPALLPVGGVALSADRRTATLGVAGMRAGTVVHLRFVRPPVAADGGEMWTTETWCTVNALGAGGAAPRAAAANTLTDDERRAGWRLLFDGQSPKGWRNFKKRGIDKRWQVENGALTLAAGGGGDIITTERFDDFEMEIEWLMSPKGNSGIFYFVEETRAADFAWRTGPEYQLLDDDRHSDGAIPSHRAGALYDMIVPAWSNTRPVGGWNRARIVSRGGRVEHWLNGRLQAAYDHGGDGWRARVAASKFGEMPEFGLKRGGHIGLQDHGDRVWFRNIKVRRLDAVAAAPQSVNRAPVAAISASLSETR